MKIIGLQAENIKKLVAVDISPEGNLVKISGKNGAGKSSLLDAIFWACAGTENIQEKPIRNGETKAFVKLSLGENADKIDYIVERKFVKKEDGEETSQLTISSPEGAKFPSPQTMLDKFLGAISFDPLEFGKMDSKKQYDTIKVISGVKFDFAKADADNKTDFQERTILNRDIKALEAQIKDIVIPELEVNALVDVSAVAKKLSDARENLTSYNSKADRQTALRKEKQEVEDEIKKLQDHLVSIDNLDKDIEEELKTLRGKLLDVDEIKDLQTQLSNANNINSAISDKKNKEALKTSKEAELREKTAKADKLTEQMEARKAEAKKAVEAANMPVKGLQLRDGEVWFNDVPFSQCSSAEQLRISTSIAMASNPKLRVIRIKEGALLDDDGLKIVETMAQDNDFQIWIELVGDKEMSIVIDNGKVKKKA